MENGHEGKLAERFSGLALDDGGGGGATGSDGLFQVMKAVVAAEATIRQQVEENNRLRSELEKKSRELERYRSNDLGIQQSDSFDSKEHFYGRAEIQQSLLSQGKLEERVKVMPNASVVDSPLVRQHDPQVGHGNTSMLDHAEYHFSSSNINGTLKVLTGGHAPVDNTGLSQPSSPSNTTFSSHRNLMDGDYDARVNLPGRVLTHMAEMNNPSSIWKQDYSVKVREHDEEIMQLRKYLADFSTKETQIRNEKYVLEKRIAYMRVAFDQQQQDLVDAASKALSYRQDIIEENVRLTYELQAAQQERSTFVSSLVPLLAEYSLQPPVTDARSIVSKIRILFRHLQEQLNQTESKVKEFQYQLGPWHPGVNPSNFSMHSPFHLDAALTTPNKNGLHLVVPQATYSSAKVPVSSVDSKTTTDWDQFGDHQSSLAGAVSRNPEQDDVGRYSPLASRGGLVLDSSSQLATTNDAHAALHGEEIPNRQVMYHNAVSNSDMDDLDDEVNRGERERSSTWGSGNSPYLVPMNDPNSSHSYLAPVLEEPSSSFSEAADDDPLPAIEGLQISGEAFPGRELQACGYSINGTTSCNFEWVRHLEDGSVNYIDGAKQPNYLVTADDVDTYLAIEVQPLDDRKRKGELVKVFANEQRKITCDPEMQRNIEKTLYTGHASYKVSLSMGYLDIWEPATFSIKREGYSIKCSGAGGVVVTDKFLPNTNVSIPYGQATHFIVSTSYGTDHLLQAENSTDASCSRDAIVLTFRLFMIRASEKKKGKKRNFFF